MKIGRVHLLAGLLGGLALAGPAAAECLSSEGAERLADAYLARKPAKLAERPGDNAEALCSQNRLVEALTAELGDPIGYKVGLTSQAAQERFGADGPVRGVLLRSMLLENGATVNPFAARGVVEADLLVTVRSDDINVATTPEEVLRYLRDVRPFIELADLVVDETVALDADVITAINVGARAGVAGTAIPVRNTRKFLNGLADMSVTLSTRPAGTEADTAEPAFTAPGKAVLGHPLNAVLWLMNDGVKLEAGDVVSLGSFGPPLPAEPGQTISVVYEGLPRDPRVSVTLAE